MATRPDSTTKPSPKPPVDTSRLPLLLPLAAMVMVLVPSFRLWTGLSPLGDDASSHIATIATLASRIANNEGWWSTDYNIGFAMGLYYQPLPHILSALFTLALGGPSKAIVAYKILITVLVAGQPWAIYWGMRRAGLDRLHAACAGALAPLVMNTTLIYGYSTFASLKVGLYTQAWGNIALPLAVGELVSVIRGRTSWLGAVVACAFTATTHMFYAIVLVPPIAALAILLPFTDAETRTLRLADRARSAVMAVGRLSVVGAGAGAILSAWFVPLTLTQSYFGGWPFSTNQKPDGYGWQFAAEHVTQMTMLDGPNVISTRLIPWFTGAEVTGPNFVVPVLTLLAVLGFFTLILRFDKTQAGVPLLVMCIWSYLGVVGREGIGPTFDLYPMHGTVQLFRYGAVAQFAWMCAGGWMLGELARWVQRLVPKPGAGVAFAVALLIAPAQRGYEQLYTGFRVLEDDSTYNSADYTELSRWLSELPDEGRMLVGPKTNTRKHFHGGLLAFMGTRPAGQSYGVGLHDSLHFYTLEFFKLDRGNAMTLADLYDFRYVVSKPGHEMSGIDDARVVIHENASYELSTLPVSGHSAMLMRHVGTVEGTPRSVRIPIREWLNGNGPATHQTVVLSITDDHSRDDLLDAPVTVEGSQTFDNAVPPEGEVLESSAVADRARAVIRVDEASDDVLAVFKIGYHPFWSISVDGEPAPRLLAYPGFLATPVGQGEHVVEARFRWPTYTTWLFALFPLVVVVAAVADLRGRSRRA